MKLSIEEAAQHAESKAKELAGTTCGVQHEQLAAWLRELMDFRKAQGVPIANPVLAYADSYRDMARQGADNVPIWGVITDLERNIAPLFTAPQLPVVLLQPFTMCTGRPFNEGERAVMIPDDNGNWLSRFDTEHAIKMAGGIVDEPSFRETAKTSTNCPKCGGRGSYHCPQMFGTVECECGAIFPAPKPGGE